MIRYFILPGILFIFVVFLAGLRYGAYIERVNTKTPTPTIVKKEETNTNLFGFTTYKNSSCPVSFTIPKDAQEEAVSSLAARLVKDGVEIAAVECLPITPARQKNRGEEPIIKTELKDNKTILQAQIASPQAKLITITTLKEFEDLIKNSLKFEYGE